MAALHARYRARPSWRDRIASAAIALGLVALLVWVLIRMGAMPFLPPGDGRALSTFDVAPAGPKAAPEERRAEQAKTTPQRAERPRASPPPPPQPLPPPEIELPGVLKLSRSDFAAADVGRIPAQPGAAAAGASADAGGASGGTAGAGPNGETLYNAEWVREPTRAEMVTYLPPNRIGWGMVACRTVERNRVEDCREMGETPGSGIARALRLASWQFLVRPPRRNGEALIGAWVRIRFDVREGVQK